MSEQDFYQLLIPKLIYLRSILPIEKMKSSVMNLMTGVL